VLVTTFLATFFTTFTTFAAVLAAVLTAVLTRTIVPAGSSRSSRRALAFVTTVAVSTAV
jgi:hypothetical protein